MGSSGEKNRTEGKGQGSAPDSKWVLLVWVFFLSFFFLHAECKVYRTWGSWTVVIERAGTFVEITQKGQSERKK